MKRIYFTLALLLSVGLTSSFAQQKYGHVNFNGLVAQMSETKAADSDLEAYQKQLVAAGEKMATEFQAKVAKYQQDVQAGGVTPKSQAEREKALGEDRNKILQYEQEVQQKLAAKREELIKPIVDKAQKAIEDYAKANGYGMIFDTSIFNSVLFAQDADDLMPALKAKLGIK
ncbi:MAG: OmpH family outer membrane protein [Saprospiraceae bacterium]|nr:OmpH family outer membrane protein [Saprospiraceae bacterium]